MSKSLIRKKLEAILTELVRRSSISAAPADTFMKSEIDTSKLLAAGFEARGQAQIALNSLAARAYVYEFPKADVATDGVVFGLDLIEKVLKVLLIERGRPDEPFAGSWALPGGFLNMDEDLEACARRELEEETHLKLAYIEQLYTFGRPDRDPRGRVLSVAYWGIVRPDLVEVQADDDAKNARWFPVNQLPSLAFDHAEIIDMALRRLRGKLRWQPVGVEFLPEKFTITQLQEVYEIILGRQIDRANLTRKLRPIIAYGVLRESGMYKPMAGRPAKTYTFDADAYSRLQRQGLDFEV